MKHKRITNYPIVIFVQGMALDDDRLAFLKHPDIRLVPWKFPVESQREKMLSAFVFGVARYVQTPWWMKLDADAYATDATPLITEEMKWYSLYGHRWATALPSKSEPWMPGPGNTPNLRRLRSSIHRESGEVGITTVGQHRSFNSRKRN